MAKTAQQLIDELAAEGHQIHHIQAKLREGFDPTKITSELAIQSISLLLEEQVRLTVHLFNQVLGLIGAKVENEEGMANAYIESLRLSQDAFFYDVAQAVQRPATVDEDGFEYEAIIDDGEEE